MIEVRNFGLLLALLISLPVSAADILSSKKKNIDEIVSLSSQTKSFNLLLNTALSQNMADFKKQYPKSTEQDIAEVLTLEATKSASNVWANLYDKYFTEDEIMDILIFFKSSAGKKFETVIPQMFQEMPQGIQAEMPLLQSRVTEELNKKLNFKSP